SQLNYETNTSHTIKVQATDGTDPSAEQTFTIAVTNVAPTTPVDGNAAGNTVSEGASNGALVGITASSTDVHGGTVTYALTDDAGGRFTIDPSTGVVSVANASLLNYETNTSHTIKVQATDGTDPSAEQTFTIAVTNVAPTTPVDGNAADNTAAQRASNGALVGITASYTDVHGGTVTYALTDDAGGRFTIDPSTGVVSVPDAPPLPTRPSSDHTIKVQATDGTDPSAEQTFTIAVTNVAPTTPVDG